MLPELAIIKGIHPGAILKRELIQRGMKPIQLAATLNEHKQTISAILNERRGINTKLSIQLGKLFEIDLDYFLQIQASYDSGVDSWMIWSPSNRYTKAGKRKLSTIKEGGPSKGANAGTKNKEESKSRAGREQKRRILTFPPEDVDDDK